MTIHKINRVLAVKLDLNLRKEAEKAIYRRLQDLSWQAMQFGNNQLRALWAEAAGLRVNPDAEDRHDVTKHIRRFEKGELSANVIDAIAREAHGLWKLHGKRCLAGAALPTFREGKSLSIRDRGVRVSRAENGFIVHLNVAAKQLKDAWLAIPLAANTAVDEYQAPLLQRMADEEVPLLKATVTILRDKGRVIVRLTYGVVVELPPPGERVATLGPLTRHGDRLLLRTELETKDYSHDLADIRYYKDEWDNIRRRATTQIGKRQGHARLKRRLLARMSWDDWLDTKLHQWSSSLIEWLVTQHVGRLTVLPIGNGDWPAARFIAQLQYKGLERGITVTSEEGAVLEAASTARSLKQNITRERRRVRKLGDALREIKHQIGSG